jgi:hypothetical protein
VPCGAVRAGVVQIDFTHFPDGTVIPNETIIRDQFAPLGVVFEEVYADGPRALAANGGVLISGGPNGFVNDIVLRFLSPVSYLLIDTNAPSFNTFAELEVFGINGVSLGTVSERGVNTFPLAFGIDAGQLIGGARFNGLARGQLTDSAASIAFLTFHTVPEPSGLALAFIALTALLVLRPRSNTQLLARE